ncbi:MAG: hypothetical protein QM783_01995 [Phycisphaerales bacterium]
MNKTPRHPGRKRRLTGYAFLTLALFTVAAWTASAWWAVELGTDRRGLRLWNGTLSHWSLHPLFEAEASCAQWPWSRAQTARPTTPPAAS